jgi:hypothetical protein
MKESSMNKNVLAVMFGILFIGGAAAIFGIVRAAKDTEGRPGFPPEKREGDIFICGAHA